MTYAQDDYRRREQLRMNEAQMHQAMEDQRRRERDGQGGGGGAELIGAVIGIGLLIAAVIWLVRILAVSLLAAAPIAGLLWLYTRLMRGESGFHFLTALKTTFIGLFVYLVFTATVAVAVGAMQAAAHTGATAALVNSMFELRNESLASLAVLRQGHAQGAALLGFLGSGMQPASTRWLAVAAMHAPGLLMFAFALNRYIGRPYQGLGGVLMACGITLVTVVPCVGGMIWFLGVH